MQVAYVRSTVPNSVAFKWQKGMDLDLNAFHGDWLSYLTQKKNKLKDLAKLIFNQQHVDCAE